MERIFVLSVLVVSVVNGLYIKNDHTQVDRVNQYEVKDKFEQIINSWLEYKRKLRSVPTSQDSGRFNELEALELIPSVIDHYRTGKISEDDENLLSEIYGSLWQIIVQESKRKANEEMNPILKALFNSFYLTKGITNDIERNTVRKVMRKTTKPRNKLLLQINNEDHPSQRVLNTAAMLIHHYSNSAHSRHQREIERREDTRQDKLNIPQTATINLQLKNIPISGITKTKRNVKIHLFGNDAVASKIDAILKMNGERFYSDEDEDDYVDEKSTSDWAEDIIDYYEYDDEKVGAPSSSDPEYGSFRDLIYLAARHRLRREQEETKLKASRKQILN